MIKVFGIKNCDTMKKAMTWLRGAARAPGVMLAASGFFQAEMRHAFLQQLRLCAHLLGGGGQLLGEGLRVRFIRPVPVAAGGVF